ncbi:hypothetical protein ACLOJK_004222, partial [Asimina triloba]
APTQPSPPARLGSRGDRSWHVLRFGWASSQRSLAIELRDKSAHSAHRTILTDGQIRVAPLPARGVRVGLRYALVPLRPSVVANLLAPLPSTTTGESGCGVTTFACKRACPAGRSSSPPLLGHPSWLALRSVSA